MLTRKGEARGFLDASYVLFLALVSVTNVDFSIICYVVHLCFINFAGIIFPDF